MRFAATQYLLGSLAMVAPVALAAEASGDMGPAAFLWPTDRTWSANEDNTAPCGSSAGVGNRTEFPLTGGSVALVAQDDSWSLDVNIAVENDPTKNSDFTNLISTNVTEMYPGHLCLPVTAPSDAAEGSNATIQLVYVSDFDTDQNQTFYACADITFVKASEFTETIPCFNVSIENTTITYPSSSSSSAASAATASVSSTSTSDAMALFGVSRFSVASAAVLSAMVWVAGGLL